MLIWKWSCVESDSDDSPRAQKLHQQERNSNNTTNIQSEHNKNNTNETNSIKYTYKKEQNIHNTSFITASNKVATSNMYMNKTQNT